MHIPVLQDIAIIFILGILLIVVGQRFKIPNMISFLVTGLVIGPYGLGWVSDINTIEIMAEIGIILLLFTIGMEFSIGSMAKIKREVLIGGGLEVILTTFAMAGFFSLFLSPAAALFAGMFASLSSTAIVLKTLINRGDLSTKHGKASLSILIFQDLAIIPMMLILPILTSDSGSLMSDLSLLVFKAALIIVAVIFLSRYVAPTVMDFIAKTRNQEFFLVFIVGLCATITFLSGELGLSLGLGAFMAGLILAETQYAHQAMSDVVPFRDLFTIFFFVSIGMLLNIHEVLAHPIEILIGLLAVIVVKALIIIILMKILKYTLGQSVGIGLMLAQVGEFSIVLTKVAFDHHILDDTLYQIFLAICLISMSLTPLLFIAADKAFALDHYRNNAKNKENLQSGNSSELENHIVIIGYGVIGKSVARAAKFTQIPFAIIELNPDTVKVEKKKGTHIIYGDATQYYVLEHVNMAKARIAVISIPDSQAVRHVVDIIAKNFPNVYIIARTRYINEVKPLTDLGAHQVLPEEYETSISIFTRVLNHLGIGMDSSENLISQLRDDDYEFLRGYRSVKMDKNPLVDLPDYTVLNVLINENSPLIDHQLKEFDFIKKYSVTVVAYKHENKVETSVHPDLKFAKNDSMFLFGKQENIRNLLSQYNLCVK